MNIYDNYIQPTSLLEIVIDENSCSICFENHEKVKLECCNQEICIFCFEKIKNCPFCRKDIIINKVEISNQIEEEEEFHFNRDACLKLFKFLCLTSICVFIIIISKP